MRLETLTKRLAEKTNTPILEKVILGQEPIEALPSECMIWTGKADKNRPGRRVRMQRDRDNLLYPALVKDRPYGVIQYQRKRMAVHRLIYQLIAKPDHEFRMTQICGGDPLCVNPLHWSVKKVEPKYEDKEEGGPPVFQPDADWTDAEIDELLETLFVLRNPLTWSDVIEDVLMTDAPAEMVRQGLLRMSKDHLT